MASLLDYVRSLTSKNTRGNAKLPSSYSNTFVATPNGPESQTQLNPFVKLDTWDPTQAAMGAVSDATQPNYDQLFGGDGGGAPDPYADLQNQIRSRIGQIMGIYDSLDTGVDQVVNERAGEYMQDYDRQAEDLNKGFSNNATQQANAYGARGLGSSSYFQNAQDESKGIYDQGINDINSNKQKTLGGLGQYAATTKAQFGAGRQQYRDILSQLGSYAPDALQNLMGTLGNNISSLESQRAGLGTTGEFVNKLNKIAPVQNNATGQLATKLQKLITSSAPQFAKDQIAQGLIKSAQLTDPNATDYWQKYYQQLLTGGTK